MKAYSIYAPAALAMVISVASSILGIQSAILATSAGNAVQPPSIDMLQGMLIQGSFTTTYVMAALAFLLIGVIGFSAGSALKSMQVRLEQIGPK